MHNPVPTTGEQKQQLQEAFREYIQALCYERVKVLYYLGIALLPLFGILDYFIAPTPLLHSFLILAVGGRGHPSGDSPCRLSSNRQDSILRCLGIIGPPIVGGSVSLMTFVSWAAMRALTMPG